MQGAQRSPSAKLRAVSLSNGKCAFFNSLVRDSLFLGRNERGVFQTDAGDAEPGLLLQR